MSNAELLSILNSARNRPASTTSGTQEKSILTFKCGTMTTELKPTGKYLVTPDLRRGELHAVWSSRSSGDPGHLRFDWKDRRTREVVTSVPVFPGAGGMFQRVETGRDDRVFLLKLGPEAWHFFWMQDKNTDMDVDICEKVNLYMKDESEAARAAGVNPPVASEASSTATETPGSDGMDSEQLLRIMQGALGSEGGRSVTGSGSIPSANAGQIDALGNIFENLGIPQPGGVPSGERAPMGGLTLADLQGAMAGLATASPPPGPPLSELATVDIIEESGVLDDPDASARLIALLPEGQRTRDRLVENIRSPQVVQCLERLTSALSEDASGFNSIIANFQLNPEDGDAALVAGNPIEAFLNCLLKDVERKEGVKGSGTEESKESGGDEEKEGDDEDAKMEES